MAVSHPHLLNFIEKNELVTFTSGKYEEVSAVVDDFDTIFKFKKSCEWSSIPLESKQTSVNGFKQSFARIYDTEPDVFAFVTIEEDTTLYVREVLDRPCDIWDGKSDLTQLDVINIINLAIDERLKSPVDYATTIKCSLFPDNCGSDVNLNRMETGFRHLDVDIPGLTTGYTYLGVPLSFFPIHKEDGDLVSLNYAHHKGGKLWFSVREEDSVAFVDILARYGENLIEGVPIWDVDFKCPAFYRHKLLWINPLVVIMEGVPVYWTFQKEGEGIATPVGIFHWGINICSNVHEAWNITSAYWSGMSSKKKRPSKPSCYPGMNAIVDRSYCICGAVADPAKLGVDGLVDGVYRAKLLSSETAPSSTSGSSDSEAPAEEQQPHDSKLPKAPGMPVLDKIRSEFVVLSWTASKTSDVRYEVQQRCPGERFWKGSVTKAYISSTRATVRRLQPGQQYEFRVLPFKGNIKGYASKPTSFIVAENPFDKPSEPQNLVFVEEGERLEWDVPQTDGGNTIIGYLLSFKDLVTGDWLKVRRRGATTDCYYLNPLRGFEYRVQAENEDGAGPPSTSVAVPYVGLSTTEPGIEASTTASSSGTRAKSYEALKSGHENVDEQEQGESDKKQESRSERIKRAMQQRLTDHGESERESVQRKRAKPDQQ